MENRKQVVVATRCTSPEAISDTTKEINTEKKKWSTIKDQIGFDTECLFPDAML